MIASLSKLISVLKIPLKIIIPAACLFCGFILYANEEVLNKLNLSEFSEEKGFVIGIVFVISICLLLVYSIDFLFKKMKTYIFYKFLPKKTIKKINSFNSTERSILFYLYKSDGYTNLIDYADPSMKSLIAGGFIYIGTDVPVSMDINNRMPIRGRLQPFVVNAINRIIEKDKKEKVRLEKKIDTLKQSNKHNKDILITSL